MARPPHPDPKILRLSLRLSPTDRDRWQACATREGRTLGDFIRWATNRAAASQKKLRSYGEDEDRYTQPVKERKR